MSTPSCLTVTRSAKQKGQHKNLPVRPLDLPQIQQVDQRRGQRQDRQVDQPQDQRQDRQVDQPQDQLPARQVDRLQDQLPAQPADQRQDQLPAQPVDRLLRQRPVTHQVPVSTRPWRRSFRKWEWGVLVAMERSLWTRTTYQSKSQTRARMGGVLNSE